MSLLAGKGLRDADFSRVLGVQCFEDFNSGYDIELLFPSLYISIMRH